MFRGGSSSCFYGSVKKKSGTDEYYSNLNTSIALGKTCVPIKHKQLASNYVLIKKIFGFSAASIPITNSDRWLFLLKAAVLL